MAGSNGRDAIAAYDHLSERDRRDKEAQADAAAGWAIAGESRYPGEWDIDLTIGDCPDRIPEHFEVDAKLLMVTPDKRNGRVRLGALKQVHVKSGGELQQLREACGWRMPAAESERIREGFGDPFAMGYDGAYTGGPLASYVPAWPGPVTRQLYWRDYFAMSAKAFEAYNHDPVSWRCVHMKQEFALGKGLQARATFGGASGKAGQTHDQAQAVWDEFWKRNRMDQRLDMMARDLSWGGEQFLRYFTTGKLTTVRSLDPASVYDLITDPEDLETVFAYHQQFQTAYQLYPPKAPTPPTGIQSPEGPTQVGAGTRYIIRQILPQEIDHYRINQSAYERRGRSDLYPALGWIKRMRDYLISHVIRADMLSRVCWDLQVKGNVAAIQSLRGLLFPNGQAPQPGTVFGHNEASTLTAIVPQQTGTGGRWDPVLDALVTMVANSIGLPKDWLGFGMGATRASALVATEPAARSLEELQGTCEMVLHDSFDRVMATAGILDAEVEFTFPSIATEDRSALLQDLSFAEANGWLSKQTAASIAAKNLGITSYDYEEEQGLIADEFPAPEMEDVPDAEPNPITGKKPQQPVQGDGKIRRPMIIATNRQAAKLDPTRSIESQEDEPPGLLVSVDGSTPASPAATPALPGQPGLPPVGAPKGLPAPPTRAGAPADENPLSTKGAANIRADNTGRPAAEAEPTFTAAQVRDMMVAVMREQAKTSPAFEKASVEYRAATASNLAELARAISRDGRRA